MGKRRRKRTRQAPPCYPQPAVGNNEDDDLATPSAMPAIAPVQEQEQEQEVSIEDCVKSLSPAIIMRACILFKKKYPGTDFIHLPSVSAAAFAGNSPGIDPIFCAALMTLCRRFITDKSLPQSEVYASYVHQNLRETIFEAPSLYTVQSLLLISFYEFGEGRGYKAWMYIGMATRMLETICSTTQESNDSTDKAQLRRSLQYNRLYWTCILQELIIGSAERRGKCLSSISIPLPGGNYDYALNHNTGWTGTMADFYTFARSSATTQSFSMDYSLSLIICGHDNVFKIMGFARSQEIGHGSFMPWMPDSPWFSLHRDLQAWRNVQDSSVRYPNTTVYAHVPFGNGAAFAYINLAFYLR